MMWIRRNASVNNVIIESTKGSLHFSVCTHRVQVESKSLQVEIVPHFSFPPPTRHCQACYTTHITF